MNQSAFESSYTGFTSDGAEWLVNNTQIKFIGKTLNIYILFLGFS